MTKKELDKMIRQLDKCVKKELSLLRHRRLPKKVLSGIDWKISVHAIQKGQNIVNAYYNQFR
jgi:hypothetical protein